MTKANAISSIAIWIAGVGFCYGQTGQTAFTKEWNTLLAAEDSTATAKAIDIVFENRNSRPADVLSLALAHRSVADRHQRLEQLGQMENCLGFVYRSLAQPDSAARHFLAAREAYRRAGVDRRAAGASYNLMNLYAMELESPTQARPLAKEVLHYFRSTNDSAFLLIALNGAAQVYFKLKEPDSTLALIAEGLELSAQLGDSVERGHLYQKLSQVYSEDFADSRLAFRFLDSAKAYADTSAFTQAYLLKLEAEICMVQGDHKRAVESLQAALHLPFVAPELEADIRYVLSQAYMAVGSFAEALREDDLSDSIQLAITNEKYATAISHFQILYKTREQREEINRLEQQKAIDDLQKTVLFISLAAIILLTLAMVYFFINRIRTNRAFADQRIAQLEKENEVISLQSMLVAQEEERQRIARDLHDGIGALLSTARLHMSNLQEAMDQLSKVNFIHETEAIIQSASNEVRRVAHDMMPGVLMKLGVVEGIEDFLERMPQQDELQIEFIYQEKEWTTRLPAKTEIMLYRIVQELFQNTIKHAHAKQVRLEMQRTGNSLTLHYDDDGQGFDPDQLREKGQFGLNSIQSRVSFLQGRLSLTTAPGAGVHYLMEFPLSA